MQSGRLAGEHPAIGHPDRIALGIKKFHWSIEEYRRRGLRQPTRPGSIERGPGNRLIAERSQGDPLGGHPTAAEYRHLYGVGTQESLHPDQRPTGSHPVIGTEAAPQRQLKCFCGNDFHGLQSQHRH